MALKLKEWLVLCAESFSGTEEYRTSGFPLLDKALVEADFEPGTKEDTEVGFQIPLLVSIGAAPKAGKSQWCQVVATHRAEQGDVVLYYDFENGPQRFLRRMLCRRAQVGRKALRRALTGKATKEVADKVSEALNWLDKLDGFYLFTDRSLSILDIRAECDKWKDVPGVRLTIIIDSLQKLPQKHGMGQRESLEAWVGEMEDLKNDYKSLVIFVSELRRPGGTEMRYQTGGTVYKGSGRIEYTAELGLTMDEEGVLRVEYNRDGDVGEIARYEKIKPFYGMREVALDTPKEEPPTTPKAQDDLPSLEALPLHIWVTLTELMTLWKMSDEGVKKAAKAWANRGMLIAMANGAYKRTK